MTKTIFFISIVSLLTMSCNSDDEVERCDFIDYYHYQDSRIEIGELSNDYILVGIDTAISDDEIHSLLSAQPFLDQTYDYTISGFPQYKFKEIPVRLNAPGSCHEITQIITLLERELLVEYVHYTMKTDRCVDLTGELIGSLCVRTYGSNFYVQVFDEGDLVDLNRLIAETNTELVRQHSSSLDWFELRATKGSQGDALRMANYFHESRAFCCLPTWNIVISRRIDDATLTGLGISLRWINSRLASPLHWRFSSFRVQRGSGGFHFFPSVRLYATPHQSFFRPCIDVNR